MDRKEIKKGELEPIHVRAALGLIVDEHTEEIARFDSAGLHESILNSPDSLEQPVAWMLYRIFP